MLSWYENKNTDQWNKIESPDKPTHLWAPYLLTRGARIYSREKTASLITDARKNGQLLVKE